MLLCLSPIKAAHTSVMNNNDQVTGELPYLQDHKLLMLWWCSFQCIVHSTSAAVNNCFHHDPTALVVFLCNWDSALWQSRVAQYSSTVHSHTTNNHVSRQKIHCSCYTSVYQPIFTTYFWPFAHNISRTKTRGQATCSSWVTINAFCSTFLHSFISSRFYCIDRHTQGISLPLWLPCWLNQSGIIWCGTYILLLWAFQILNASVVLHIRFIVCRTIILAVIWIRQLAIPV